MELFGTVPCSPEKAWQEPVRLELATSTSSCLN